MLVPAEIITSVRLRKTLWLLLLGRQSESFSCDTNSFISLKPEQTTGTDNQDNRTTRIREFAKTQKFSLKQQRLDVEAYFKEDTHFQLNTSDNEKYATSQIKIFQLQITYTAESFCHADIENVPNISILFPV